MRGSLGLSAYRTITGRRTPPDYAPQHPRPRGDIIWVHAAEVGNNRALNDLAHRLADARDDCHVVITAAHGTIGTRGNDAVLIEPLPPEHPDATNRFVTHWKPDVVIWAWGGLRPNLIQSASDAGAFMILVDAAHDGFDGRRDRWLPEVPRRLLARFHRVIARDAEAHQRLAHLCRTLDLVDSAAPLHPFGRILPAADSDVSDVTEALGGRAAWLAMNVALDEAQAVLSAHKRCVKGAHRLLLILHLATPDETEAVAATAQDMGLRTAIWGAGELPDDNCQVLFADTTEDLGLWLRIAPVTFLGGSLRSGQSVSDPYSVAAHGTALIYGPHVTGHADAFTRLMNAGAARIVNSADTLARAVSQVIAPDQAAQMAMAGWDVVTQGADSLDRIVDMVHARLDAPHRDGR